MSDKGVPSLCITEEAPPGALCSILGIALC